MVKAAKFPAAQPPDPNMPSKIETEYWPCPPSLAAMGNSTQTHVDRRVLIRNCSDTSAPPPTEIEWKKKKLPEEDEFEDLTEEAETLQEQELQRVCDRRPTLRDEEVTLTSDLLFSGVSAASSDPVQPGPSDPQGGEGESRPLQEEDTVAPRQNAHAQQ